MKGKFIMEKSMEKINSTIFDLELKLIKGKIDLVRLYDLNKGEEVILQEIIILQDHITSGFYYSTLDTGFIKCKEELLKLITLEELNHLLDLQTKLSNLKMENNLKGVFRDVASLKKFKQYA